MSRDGAETMANEQQRQPIGRAHRKHGGKNHRSSDLCYASLGLFDNLPRAGRVALSLVTPCCFQRSSRPTPVCSFAAMTEAPDSLLWLTAIQIVERKQNLSGLTPKNSFVATKAVELIIG